MGRKIHPFSPGALPRIDGVRRGQGRPVGVCRTLENLGIGTQAVSFRAPVLLREGALDIRLAWMAELGQPRSNRRLAVVLFSDEVSRLLGQLHGEHQ